MSNAINVRKLIGHNNTQMTQARTQLQKTHAYLLEVEQEIVGGQGAAAEEVLAHPAVLVVARHLSVREDVHKQLWRCGGRWENRGNRVMVRKGAKGLVVRCITRYPMGTTKKSNTFTVTITPTAV